MTAPTLTVPTSPEELEEWIGDSARMQTVFKDRTAFKELIKNYARTVMDKDSTIAAQVREETQLVLAEYLQSHGQELIRPDLSPSQAPSRPAGYNPKAPGAKIDGLFADHQDFYESIWHLNRTPEVLDKQRKMHEIRASFGSTVPSDGGFLIPETLRSEILRVALETALVRPRARVIPMESLVVPMPMIDSTSNASSVYGGVTAFWTEESATLTDTSPKFGRVKLEAQKLTLYAAIPNELFTDSIISLQAFIDELFPEALAWFEDKAFISGTGVGEPQGFLNAPAAVSVAKESGQAALTIVWENIVKAFSRMLPASLGRAVWVCHIDTFPELATMALSVGTGGSAIWLTNGAAPYPMTILGRPAIFTEKVSSVGTAGDINFVDFGYYLIGDRQTMTSMTSPHYRFANDQTAMRFIERVDGRPWLQSPITPAVGSNTLSPFVKIATR